MAEIDAEERSVRGTTWSGVLELDLRWQLHYTSLARKADRCGSPVLSGHASVW